MVLSFLEVAAPESVARAEGSGGSPALPEFRFSQPVHMPARLPIALNSFGLWLALMIGLTLTNYGFPIAQLLAQPQTSVPAVMMKPNYIFRKEVK